MVGRRRPGWSRLWVRISTLGRGCRCRRWRTSWWRGIGSPPLSGNPVVAYCHGLPGTDRMGRFGKTLAGSLSSSGFSTRRVAVILPPEPPASIVDRGRSPFWDGAPADRAAWSQLCNLQRRILPQVAPPIPGYQLVLAYRASFVVTGDYHDFFRRPDGQAAVFVGDGSGHGPAASMVMAMMRTI